MNRAADGNRPGALLTIADVVFSVTAAGPVAPHSGGPAYASFLGATPVSGRFDDVDIALRACRSPRVRGAEVFRSGDSWLLKRRGATRILEQGRIPSRREPAWTAVCRPPYDKITIRCGHARGGSNARGAIRNPLSYPLDQLLLMFVLAFRRGIIVHACGARIGGRGAVFAGVSGAGKTTLARLLSSCPGVSVLSDDRVAVRGKGRGYRVYGTPWPGELNAARNASAPLAAIYLLRHGARTRIRRLDPGAAIRGLLPVASLPWCDPQALDPALAFCGELARRVPCYALDLLPGRRALDCLRGRLAAAGA